MSFFILRFSSSVEPFEVCKTHLPPFNEFITCFSRILNLPIYEFFSQNLMFHFLKASFFIMKNSFIGISIDNFSLVEKQNEKKIVKKNCRFVDSGIVKTCNELARPLMKIFTWNSKSTLGSGGMTTPFDTFCCCCCWPIGLSVYFDLSLRI